MNNVKETKLVVRIDEELLNEFKKVCKKHELTMSQLLRVQIKKFVLEAGGKVKK